ncbi:MAG: hypothetical protein RLY61_530 [Candidatus Parcubacteria bacterium]
MNRLITSVVQLALAIPALYMGRLVWREIVADFREWDKSH